MDFGEVGGNRGMVHWKNQGPLPKKTAHQPRDHSSDLNQKPCCEERRRWRTHNLPADADPTAGIPQDEPDRRVDLGAALEWSPALPVTLAPLHT